MPEAVSHQQQSRPGQQDMTARPPAQHGLLQGQVGQLHAVASAVNMAPQVAALSAMGALMSARAARAPVQRQLNRALPDGDFFKADLRTYQADIDASLRDLQANWRALRNRYQLFADVGAVPAAVAAYHTLVHVTGPQLASAQEGRFTDAKRQRLVAAYNQLRAAEQARSFAAAETALNGYVEIAQLPIQLNPAGRIIGDLEARTRAGGADRLFGDALRRNADNTWNFWQANPLGGADLVWVIRFAVANTSAATIAAVVDAATRHITVTIGRHPIPVGQSPVYERLIADAITAQYRVHAGFGVAGVFTRAAMAGGATTTGDDDRVETLRQIYARYQQDEADFLAAPNDVHRKLRVRGILARLSATVEEMHLDEAGKRGVFAAIPGLSAALKDKVSSHGMFHAMRQQSMAHALGDPLADAAQVGVRVLTPELIEHMIAVSGRNGADFLSMGLNGGHDDGRLQEFVLAHPRYALVPAAAARQVNVPLGGVGHQLQVQGYRQFIWQGGGDPPAAAAQRPSAAAVPAGWTEAQVPKTTVDDLGVFLLEGRRTYLAWWQNHAANRADENFGRVPNVANPVVATGASGLGYGGYVRPDAVHRDDVRQAIRKLDTIFPTV